MVAICEYVGFHKNVNKLRTGFENFESVSQYPVF